MSDFNELRLTDTMPFGKYKGQEIEDLLYEAPNYLAWCANEEIVQFDEEVIKQMEDRKLI
jgi:uncharacterized protein (DUF3820 family)